MGDYRASWTNEEICKCLADDWLAHVREMAKNPRRYSGHDLRSVLSDSADIMEEMAKRLPTQSGPTSPTLS